MQEIIYFVSELGSEDFRCFRIDFIANFTHFAKKDFHSPASFVDKIVDVRGTVHKRRLMVYHEKESHFNFKHKQPNCAEKSKKILGKLLKSLGCVNTAVLQKKLMDVIYERKQI